MINLVNPTVPTFVEFSNWSFSSSELYQLPLDPVRENYVRKVKNCIFSEVVPSPLLSGVELVIVSRDALENNLNLNFTEIIRNDDFRDFVSGRRLIDATPLAHR